MDERPLQIAIVVGEPSGDRQGAALLTALRERAAPRLVTAWGVGGPAMRDAGVALRVNSEGWATIGLAATLVHLPFLLLEMIRFRRALAAQPPDALVLIDSGGVNVRLARWVKRRSLCPIFYYFPPGSWRRAAPRKSTLASVTDRIVTPFPWSETLLRASGADAHFVGHPLLDLVRPSLSEADFYARFGLDPHRPLVALLPGSREGELRHILPALIGAAGEIAQRIPGVQFMIALASGSSRPLVEAMIRREQQTRRGARLQLLMHQAGDRLSQIAHNAIAPTPLLATSEGLTLPADLEAESPPPRERPQPGPAPLVICEGLTYDVMARSDLVITKSGTSTLEALILQKPMIIVYRGSALLSWEFRRRQKKTDLLHIGLPNILAQERVVPELLQEQANPEAISELAIEFLLQPERLLHLKEQLVALARAHLGEPGGVRRAADLLYDLATDKCHD